ncbi:MAG: (Fe-S)-binding protein, partial [Gemmataceae bacterium]
ASVGCLHIRPLIALDDPADLERMVGMATEVADLVVRHGGALSGEHGDGFSRSQWNRKMFGSKLYDAFCQIKQLFDPQGLFNPGRIVHGPPMTDNLRYPPGYSPVEPTTVMDYSAQAGFLRAIEMCNGSGACRKTQGGTMCPSFRVTLDEQDSPRGRANALRHALADLGTRATPGEISRTMRQTWLQDVFDLCVMCKACKSECPSNVDVAKLKAEWMQIRYRGRVRPLEHWLVACLPYINRWTAPIAALVNWIQSRPSTHRLLEAMAGLDRRRNLPRLHADHFRKWFRRHQPDPQAGTRGKVVIMADCFTTYFEPGVGQAATEVLERAGYEVQLAEFFCCGRTLISKGFLDKAQNWVKSQVQSLARMAEPGVPILGLEPSCLLTLRDEWPDLLPGEATRRLAQSAHLADVWLAQQFRDKGLPAIFGPCQDSVLIHGHCHQKALLGTASTAAGVSLVEGLKVETLDSGCCGMAGSFGMEREHYEVSRKMADLSLLPALAAKPDATVIASGISCRQQIHDFAGRGALHPMEFLRRHLNAAPSPPTP